MRSSVILIHLWTALLICEGITALHIGSMHQDVIAKRGMAPTPEFVKMLIRANEAADKAATDLLNTYNTYKHVQKFGDMLDKDGVGSATTTTAGDQGRRSHYIPVDSAGSENQYRLTSKLDGRYALETKKPGGDWRITRGDEAARNAERSAVKALNKLGKSPKRSQLKKVANAMHEVSKAYERKT